MGGVISDLRHDLVRTVNWRTNKVNYDELNKVYEELEEQGDQLLERERISVRDRYFKRTMDMRYVGQFHEVDVDVPNEKLGPGQMEEVIRRFNEKHEAMYAYRDTVETEIINVRSAGFGRVVKMSLKEYPCGLEDTSAYQKGTRKVFFEEADGFMVTPIYDGDAMQHGNVMKGPAVIEQKITTIVVPPGYRIEVGKYGDYIMDVPE